MVSYGVFGPQIQFDLTYENVNKLRQNMKYFQDNITSMFGIGQHLELDFDSRLLAWQADNPHVMSIHGVAPSHQNPFRFLVFYCPARFGREVAIDIYEVEQYKKVYEKEYGVLSSPHLSSVDRKMIDMFYIISGLNIDQCEYQLPLRPGIASDILRIVNGEVD